MYRRAEPREGGEGTPAPHGARLAGDTHGSRLRQ